VQEVCERSGNRRCARRRALRARAPHAARVHAQPRRVARRAQRAPHQRRGLPRPRVTRSRGAAGAARGVGEGGRDETCPVSTEGWTRRVHFVRGRGRGRDTRLFPPRGGLGRGRGARRGGEQLHGERKRLCVARELREERAEVRERRARLAPREARARRLRERRGVLWCRCERLRERRLRLRRAPRRCEAPRGQRARRGRRGRRGRPAPRRSAARAALMRARLSAAPLLHPG
jgi:hypothetical protein